MKHSVWAGLLLSALPMAVEASAFTEEFESGLTRPVSVAVLPARVLIVEQKLAAGILRVDLEGELAEALDANMRRLLESQGYKVQSIDVSGINADPLVQELVGSVYRRYETLQRPLRSAPRRTARHRYNLGDEARMLAARLGVDALVYPDMRIFAQAPGAMATTWILGIVSPGSNLFLSTSFLLSVAVIDGNSGDIEALFLNGEVAFTGYQAIMEDPTKKLAPLVEGAIEELPAADPSLRPARHQEDVLRDTEALLSR
jgi:hypothetical protein